MSAYDELLVLGDSLVEALDQVIKTQCTLPATHQLAERDARLLMPGICLQLRHWRADLIRAHEPGKKLWLEEEAMSLMRESFAMAEDQLDALKQDHSDLADSPWRCFYGGPLAALAQSVDGISDLGRSITEEVPDLSPWSSEDEMRTDTTDEALDSESDSGEDMDVRVEAVWAGENLPLHTRHTLATHGAPWGDEEALRVPPTECVMKEDPATTAQNEQIQDIAVKRLPDIEASRPQRHAQGVVESVKQAQGRMPYEIEPTTSSQVSQAGKVGGHSQGPKHDSRAVREESYDASSSSADEDDDDSADDDLSDTSSSVSGVAAGGGQKQNRHF
ncbi:hypothetical protein LTS10_000930 [Elasticomyces elasticus]|nr:hypothetical protein LTS10_000930 [Elasticomyces elasticus]